MKTANPVLAALIAAAIFMAFQSPAIAERWSAIGLITTQVHGQEARVRDREFDDFDDKELCVEFVKTHNKNPDYVGEGGTSGHVPRVDWNYEGSCVQKGR